MEKKQENRETKKIVYVDVIAPRTPDVDVRVSSRLFPEWILGVLEGLSGLKLTGGRWSVRATLAGEKEKKKRREGRC